MQTKSQPCPHASLVRIDLEHRFDVAILKLRPSIRWEQFPIYVKTAQTNTPARQFHPLLAGLEDATRIINGVNRVIVRPARPSSNSPLTVVPSYPNLPMEEVFPRPTKSLEPGVFLREIGDGRVVYFPSDLGRTFWEVLNVDHGKLIHNALLWAINEFRLISVEGPGVLDIAVWNQRQSMTVHLVNLTNPMMMKAQCVKLFRYPASKCAFACRTESELRVLISW